MHTPFRFVAAVCLLSTAAVVAQPNYRVAPVGYDQVEGAGNSSLTFGRASGRVQQAENSLTGTALTIRSIAWRRDLARTTTPPTFTRTISINILMANTNFATFSSTFSNNYSGTPTTVFSASRNLDWTKAPAITNPAPFTEVFAFSAPFVYTGKTAFLWETAVTSTSAATSLYSQDWVNRPLDSSSLRGDILGTGCRTANGNFTMAVRALVDSSSNMTVTYTATGGPSTSLVFAYAGLGNPNIRFLCGRLHTDALFSFNIGNTDASGGLMATVPPTGGIGFTAAMQGLAVTTQLLAFDRNAPGGGVLSNGIFTRLPRAAGGAALQQKRTFASTNVAATTGSTPSNTSVATRYN